MKRAKRLRHLIAKGEPLNPGELEAAVEGEPQQIHIQIVERDENGELIVKETIKVNIK